MSDVGLGMRLAATRLRGASGQGGGLVFLGAVLAAAAVLRTADPLAAVDVTLAGALFGVSLPLFAYLVVSRACLRGRLDLGVSALSRHGASRRAAVLGVVLRAAFHVAVFGAVAAFLAVQVASPRPSLPALEDGLTAGWIGAAAALTYVAWLSLGSLFGRKGGGRALCLAVDLALGSGRSSVAFFWPRAHIRSLLGGDPVLHLGPQESALALALLAALYLGAALLCVRR